MTTLLDIFRCVTSAKINSRCQSEDETESHIRLCEEYGPDNVWDTEALQDDFVIEGFSAPFVVAIRRSDRQIGSLMFQHMPRFYFNWKPRS